MLFLTNPKVSGPSSYGKSRTLDVLLHNAHVVSMDSKGCGRYASKSSVFYYSDVAVSDILGRKEDVSNEFKQSCLYKLLRHFPLSRFLSSSTSAEQSLFL